jgi:hypothetical protein
VFLGSGGTSILLSIAILVIYIPINSVKEFLCSISLPAFVIDDNHSD